MLVAESNGDQPKFSNGSYAASELREKKLLMMMKREAVVRRCPPRRRQFSMIMESD